MAQLDLIFAQELGEFQLVETSFTHPLLTKSLSCVRGRTCGAHRGFSSFQWTRAVQGLVSLLIRAKLREVAALKSSGPELVGYRGSLVAALDYALSKQPLWLIDMLGVDSRGTALARRMVLRTNPEGKRPGPLGLSLNTNMLLTSQICFKQIDGTPLTAEQMTMIDSELWRGEVDSSTVPQEIAA